MLALKWVFLACAGVIVLFVALVALLIFMPLWPFERAIATTFNGETDNGPASKYAVVCLGFDCDQVLSRLPPVSSVSCRQSMVSDNHRPKYDVHIVGIGACCLAQFGELGRTEVHIYRQTRRYTILLTEPRMRDIVKALDEQPSRG